MRRILVVCTANQCRSPMAEGLLRARLSAAGRDADVAVASAGTWAAAGRPATDHALATLSERGIDLAEHRSREVTSMDVAAADLVLVMTDSHRAALLTEFPAARGKILLFSQLAGGGWDVADPIGQPIDAYRATADELDRLIDAGWARILGQES